MRHLQNSEQAGSPDRQTMLDLALHDGEALVVGGGFAAQMLIAQLQHEANLTQTPLTIHWAFDNTTDGASPNAGAYHAVFNSRDPRMAQWAVRSWHMADIYERLNVAHIIRDAPTLYLSNQPAIPLPPGLPGPALEVDPADYGLQGIYRKAAFVRAGRVFSPRELIPAIARNILATDGVTRYDVHFRGLEDLLLFSNNVNVRAVFVCAGAATGRLFGHDEVVGSLGVLLHVPLSPELGHHASMVFMDEDDDERLAYTIPAPASGTVGVGGTVGELFDYPYSPGASDLPDHRDQREAVRAVALREAKYIKARAMEQFPDIAKALARVPSETATYALRPQGAGVILRTVPIKLTGEVVIAEVGALGGSGYTIGPAVAQDALYLPVPETLLSGERKGITGE